MEYYKMKKEKYKPKTTRMALLLVVFSTVLISLGQLFYKLSFLSSDNLLSKVIFSPYLYIGLIFYALGAVVLIVALKHGELSTLYPFIALSFVWVSLFSFYLLKETFTSLKVLGIVSIITGVVLVGFGS